MQPNEQMRLAIKAIQELGLSNTQKIKTDICQILAENGGDERKFMRAVSKVKNMHKSDRGRVSDVLAACYEDEMSKISSVSCDYCRGSGFLNLIQLCGLHDRMQKTWVLNFKKHEKQCKFLKSNKTFTAQIMKYPCSCENGSKRNGKFDGDWLKPEIRRELSGKAYIATFGTQEEMEAEEAYINYQMMNRVNGFKNGQDLPVHGVDRNKKINVEKIKESLK